MPWSASRTALVASIVAYDTAQVGLLRAMGGVSADALLGGATGDAGTAPE